MVDQAIRNASQDRTPPSAAAIPVKSNLAIAAAVIAANLFQFIVLPLVLLPYSPAWGWALVPVVLLTSTFWSTIHEAMHSHLLPDKRANDRLGRVLAILFGSPFQGLRFGHLAHHRFNRMPIDRGEVYKTLPKPWPLRYLAHYFVILGGLYLGEVAVSLAALLPKRVGRRLCRLVFGHEAPDGSTKWHAAERALLAEPGYSLMRVDGLAVVGLFGLSFWLYGADGWMLLLALAGRGLIASMSDNAYHYGNVLDDRQVGYNLGMPRLAEIAFLNFNLHAVHHRSPTLPWTALPAKFREERDRYHVGYLSAVVRQLAGPLHEDPVAAGRYDIRFAGEHTSPLPRTARQ